MEKLLAIPVNSFAHSHPADTQFLGEVLLLLRGGEEVRVLIRVNISVR